MKIPVSKRMPLRISTIVLMISLLFLVGLAIGASVQAASEDAGHDDHGTKGWVATDTYKVMNFAVLAIALFFLLRKPAAQALNARIDGIRDQLTDLEAKKKKAEQQLAEYNERLALLDQEAAKLLEDYKQQGLDAKARIIEEAKASAQKLEEQAKRNIENEFKKAKAGLQEEIVDQALAKAEEVLKTKITNDDQEKLVDEYLAKVVA